jgi:hypothetical protein
MMVGNPILPTCASPTLWYTTPMTIQLDKYIIPEHISYSAFTTFIDCGYQYYLGRLLQLPEAPSVWSVGGSSFHTATEMWDLENL